MGNFLYNVDKSRKEWLKKPNPISNRARFLNANLNTSLVINQPILEPNPSSDVNTNVILKSGSISDK
jgi:hypothetical protein